MSRHPHAFFDACVNEALAAIPAEFQPYLENLEIVVEDWAPEELLDELGVPEDEDLYGLFSGPSLLERDPAAIELPPRVTLYRGPLLEDFPEPEDLRREIAVTVLHEVAHHFGIPDARLEELGWG